MAKKKKQSAMGLFFAFFLKAVVIILGLVILAMSAFLVKTVIMAKDTESQSEADENAFEEDQEDELLTSQEFSDDELLYDDSQAEVGADGEEISTSNEIAKDASIVVLNGTQTAGLAAAWKEKLAEQGFTNIQTGNYLNGTLETSKLVTSDETLSALQGGPEGVEIEVASSDSVATDVPPEGVVVYLLVGWDNDIVSQQASE